MRGQYLLQTASTRELLCGEWERKDSTVSFRIYVRPYRLLSKYPTGKGLGKCSLKNLSSPDLSERETGRGV